MSQYQSEMWTHFMEDEKCPAGALRFHWYWGYCTKDSTRLQLGRSHDKLCQHSEWIHLQGSLEHRKLGIRRSECVSTLTHEWLCTFERRIWVLKSRFRSISTWMVLWDWISCHDLCYCPGWIRWECLLGHRKLRIHSSKHVSGLIHARTSNCE